MEQTYAVVGHFFRRLDGVDKVTGKALFAADVSMEGMLWGKTLRSTIPHGVLDAIDVEAARALPGVHAVVTGADIPGANAHGIILKDEPVCVPVGGKIRRVGEPLALVAAETEAVATEALRLIKVSITELPGVFDMFEAMKPETPRLHDHPNFFSRHIEKGDIDAAFASADMCVESEYHTQQVEHAYIEPEAGLAFWDGDIMTVYVATQNPHYDAKEVARNLGIGMHKVRVIQTVTGGGFGGKLDMSVSVPAALLARAASRPVRLVWNRTESLTASVKRHPYVVRMRHGVKADGTLVALHCFIYCDTGAYASYGPGVLTRAAVHCTGPYFIPNVRTEAYTVFTNNPTAGAMRGFGVPQMSFVVESQMDIIAEKLGMSPYTLRLKNALRPGDSICTGSVLKQSVGIVKTLEAVHAKTREVMHIDLATPRWGREPA
ncbi:molybdopterin cofactor-binding domain-containing protein [Desulfovibrio aminophilus]|uniref:xanthine dehydrogenase family protein molybdopterin-binding subunit n=1 Tax=Desulfovibrio aminophilus TaxID=81425 RepID=UPI003399966F